VRSFDGAKYLSLRGNSEIHEVDDIVDIVDDATFDGAGKLKVFKGEIVAIISNGMYNSCRNCNTKVSGELSGSGITVCVKCGMKMKLSKCTRGSVARVILEDEDQKEYKVTIFSDILNKIAAYGKEVSSSEEIDDQLMSAPTLLYTVNLNCKVMHNILLF